MSDKLQGEISKAAMVMRSYGMSEADAVTVIRILVDAGVEKCLDEQQALREKQDEVISKAYAGIVH